MTLSKAYEDFELYSVEIKLYKRDSKGNVKYVETASSNNIVGKFHDEAVKEMVEAYPDAKGKITAVTESYHNVDEPWGIRFCFKGEVTYWAPDDYIKYLSDAIKKGS